jgi:hypothetical protein
MNDMAPRAVMPEGAQARVNGVIDVLRSNRVAGWAIDRSDSSAAVAIDILREGRHYRTVAADRYRADLEKGGIGTGRYGFAVEIDPPIEPGFEFTIAVLARTSDGHNTPLKAVGAADHAPSPDLQLLAKILTSLEELRPRRSPSDQAAETVLVVANRLEVAQARLEAALVTLENRPVLPDKVSLPKVAYAAGLLGVALLGVGMASIWFG